MDSSNLMISSDKKKLVQVGEAIKALTFPFKYEFINIPYLPPSLIDYVNAPLPFLIGIESQYLDQAEDIINDGTYIIDLDNNKITSKHKTSVTLQSNGRSSIKLKDDLPELPNHYAHKLQKKISGIVKKKYHKKERLSIEEVDKIRLAFFNFFVNVF